MSKDTPCPECGAGIGEPCRDLPCLCGDDRACPAHDDLSLNDQARLLIDAYSSAIDMVEELAMQGMPFKGSEYLDCAISTYEDACDFLAQVRPERWQVTPRGMLDLSIVKAMPT